MNRREDQKVQRHGKKAKEKALDNRHQWAVCPGIKDRKIESITCTISGKPLNY